MNAENFNDYYMIVYERNVVRVLYSWENELKWRIKVVVDALFNYAIYVCTVNFQKIFPSPGTLGFKKGIIAAELKLDTITIVENCFLINILRTSSVSAAPVPLGGYGNYATERIFGSIFISTDF